MKTLTFGFAFAVSMAMGCAADRPEVPGDVASLKIALSGGDFTGNSVQICGMRSGSVLPCATDVPCACYNFNADGQPESSPGVPLVLDGLCPSLAPGEEWTFTYIVYLGTDCTGDQITGTDNFVCYDSSDAFSRENPNTSVELLTPGLNQNLVLCLTQNASKEWKFAECVQSAIDPSRYACGCVPDGGGACNCDDDLGLTDEIFDSGCTFDPANCDIICVGAVNTFACDGTLYLLPQFTTTRDVLTLDSGTLVTATSGAASSSLRLSAIGLNPVDGFLYAINNDVATPTLVRIPKNGPLEDLGPIAELDGHEWVVGTFTSDGRYVIGALESDNLWLVLDVQAPAVLNSGNATIPIPYGWAAHPTDGLIYGYGPGNRLSSFNPTTGVFQYLSVSQVANLGDLPCSVAFDSTGRFLAYCPSHSGPPVAGDVDSLYAIDIPGNSATFVGSRASVAVPDVTSCPF